MSHRVTPLLWVQGAHEQHRSSDQRGETTTWERAGDGWFLLHLRPKEEGLEQRVSVRCEFRDGGSAKHLSCRLRSVRSGSAPVSRNICGGLHEPCPGSLWVSPVFLRVASSPRCVSTDALSSSRLCARTLPHISPCMCCALLLVSPLRAAPSHRRSLGLYSLFF